MTGRVMNIEYQTKCISCSRDIVITATTMAEIQALQEKVNKPQQCETCSSPDWGCCE